MMRGETVYVDGAPVDNVLVSPGGNIEGDDPALPAGAVVAYTLAFPASYPGPVHDSKVTVRGVECDTVGFSDHNRPADVFGGAWIEELCPWDMTVPVRLAAGDMTADIELFATVTTYDELGRPVRTRTAVYAGPAQARREKTSADGERRLPDGAARAVETWRFVVPWRDAFALLRPESTVVAMGGADYDAVSVEDVGMKGEFLCVKAVRHG